MLTIFSMYFCHFYFIFWPTSADASQWPVRHKPEQHVCSTSHPCCSAMSWPLHINALWPRSHPLVLTRQTHPTLPSGSCVAVAVREPFDAGVSLKRFTASDLEMFKRRREVQIFHGTNGQKTQTALCTPGQSSGWWGRAQHGRIWLTAPTVRGGGSGGILIPAMLLTEPLAGRNCRFYGVFSLWR